MKGKRHVNIFDVANEAGVSPATVSRCVNHPEKVSADTRRLVEAAIRETGYVRNRAAQAFHGRRSGTIGLVVPTVDYAIFASMVQAFTDAAEAAGFTLLLGTHGYDLEQEYRVVRKLLEHRVDGIALTGLDRTEDCLALLARQSTPALSVWNYDPASALPSVGAVNAEAGELAARHLVELGHRRIALVFPPTTDNDRARARMNSALAVLAAHGATPQPDHVARCRYDTGLAKKVVGALLAQKARPTAILCGNDVIARGALYAAREAGLSVPEALSVAGIGDFAGSSDMVPALTTVGIPAVAIGTEAAALLIHMIGEETSIAPGVAFPVTLHARETTAPPAAGRSSTRPEHEAGVTCPPWVPRS